MKNKEMTVKEIARMSDWLKANGHSSQEIIDCIHYIAEANPEEQKKKSGSHIAKKPD